MGFIVTMNENILNFVFIFQITFKSEETLK